MNVRLKTIFTTLKLEPSKEIDDEVEKLSTALSYNLDTLKRLVKIGNYVFKRIEENKINLDEIRDDFEKLELKKEDFEKIKSLYEDFGKKYALNRLKYDAIRSNLYSLSPKLDKILYEINIRNILDKNEENPTILYQIPLAFIEMKANVETKDIYDKLFTVQRFTFNGLCLIFG